MEGHFRTVWRGYDRDEVDAFLKRVRSEGVGDAELMEHPFRRTLRGYDPEQVDVHLDELAQRHHDG